MRSKEEIIFSQNTFKEYFNKVADIGTFFKNLLFIGCRVFFTANDSWQYQRNSCRESEQMGVKLMTDQSQINNRSF